MQSPFPNSYWLEPEHILCGEYPKNDANIEAILKAGVLTFIDLTHVGELPAYQEPAQEKAVKLGIDPSELEFYRYSILDGSIPNSTEEMEAILEQVAEAKSADRPVYIHCWGGKGRTGTVAGCVLSELLDCDGADAFKALQDRWKNCAKSATASSPETDEQCGFIRKWDRKGNRFSN